MVSLSVSVKFQIFLNARNAEFPLLDYFANDNKGYEKNGYRIIIQYFYSGI